MSVTCRIPTESSAPVTSYRAAVVHEFYAPLSIE